MKHTHPLPPQRSDVPVQTTTQFAPLHDEEERRQGEELFRERLLDLRLIHDHSLHIARSIL